MTRTTLNPTAKNAVPSPRSGLKSRKPSPLALEARLMFDGAAIATHAPDAAAPAPEAAVLERALPAERGVASVASEAAREGAQVIGRDGAPKEIVFVDAGVSDWQKLVANAKPHPEPYQTAADLLRVDPRDTVALEDSIPGATSALAAGSVVVAVAPEVTHAPHPRLRAAEGLEGLTWADLAQTWRELKEHA